MSLQLYSRLATRQWRAYKSLGFPRQFRPTALSFSGTARAQAIKPFLLADIGEGIRECEIIQWFVEPEAQVEEWDKLCEVQSDKASVEITSRFAGVIKKLHYEAGEMAKVGKPLVDIDIQGESEQEDITALAGAGGESETQTQKTSHPESTEPRSSPKISSLTQKPILPKGKHASLATPAVRHLTKELDVDIRDVHGTGRDGRVSKADVYQFAKTRDTAPESGSSFQHALVTPSSSGPQTETITQLSNIQHQMFKTMTKSLAIPHFLYADEIDFSGIGELRARLNKGLAKHPVNEVSKLSFLPFIIKAVSMAIHRYPVLNARVDVDPKSSKPILIMRSQHNIGVAMDTPTGLIVPVIKNVSSLNIVSIAAELSRLQLLASTGKLSSQDLNGGTVTVSNIGSIGGTYVSPVITVWSSICDDDGEGSPSLMPFDVERLYKSA
ncbi:2-oxoacid dehydrogenase acyltransferase [Diplocarpon rosae]|nr:2-oxoacid dehydrogenase acyltransferase [Diplocarpon rosae]